MTAHATATPTAAASGALATDRFKTDKLANVADTPKERVDLLAREVLEAVHQTIRRHKVSYDEYNALKSWLINIGQDGEWPLFLDVWVEHVVEEVANEDRQGSKGTIEGPYYVPDAPRGSAEMTLPMRENEAGTPLLFGGRCPVSTVRRCRRPRSRSGTPTRTACIRSSRRASRSGTCAAR